MNEIKLGVQLYNLRDYCQNEKDFDNTLNFLDSIGCNVIQISGIGDIEPKVVAEIVNKYNMDVCVTHTSYDRMKNDLSALIDEHELINCDYIGMGGMSGQFSSTQEGITGFIYNCNNISLKMAERGKTLCYHNHAFEFEYHDGLRTFDRLINETKNMYFIPDTYWMQVGGVNPADFLKKLNGRVEVCHFKDMEIVNGKQQFADCGYGNIDLGACYRSCKEIGVKYIVCEQDECYGKDVFKCTERSFRGLQKIATDNK